MKRKTFDFNGMNYIINIFNVELLTVKQNFAVNLEPNNFTRFKFALRRSLYVLHPNQDCKFALLHSYHHVSLEIDYAICYLFNFI